MGVLQRGKSTTRSTPAASTSRAQAGAGKRRNSKTSAAAETVMTEPEVVAGFTIPAGMPDCIEQCVDENGGANVGDKFPIPGEALIRLTRGVLALNNGVDDESVLAEDFKFVAPVVGPLEKEMFLAALRNFKIKDGFPDLNGNFYHFRMDPYYANRVWFTSQAVGTHTGDMGPIKATGKKVESPPQAMSMTFNEEGKVTQITVGYVMDKNIGNQGGLGGIFGIFYAIGFPLPFPEARAWQKSWQMRMFTSGNKVAQASLFIMYAIWDNTIGRLMNLIGSK